MKLEGMQWIQDMNTSYWIKYIENKLKKILAAKEHPAIADTDQCMVKISETLYVGTLR